MSMTENESMKEKIKMEYHHAIDLIRRIKTEETHERYIDRHKALGLAIQALEEIQQYRVIGTVQEVAKLSNSWTSVNYKLRQFEKIGTIEEFKALKEKSVAKKPIRKPNHNWTDEEVSCPTCGSYILGNKHHCKCGQALDWEV